jgi:flavin reductase (DIM6/NTAB) family NADH-FMN oxidoreductase RutF
MVQEKGDWFRCSSRCSQRRVVASVFLRLEVQQHHQRKKIIHFSQFQQLFYFFIITTTIIYYYQSAKQKLSLFLFHKTIMTCFHCQYFGILLGLLCSVASIHQSTALILQRTTYPPILNVPTYSLATLNEDGSTNMNVLTYATPVSISPQRVWSMGVFKSTLSDENLRRTGVCVLQLLTDQHVDAVSLLGGFSGREVDKKAECEKLSLKWQDLNDKDGFQVLPGCASYIKMKVQGGVVDAGSHGIFPFCEVTEMFTSEVNGDGLQNQHLSTRKLREWGIISDKGRVEESKLPVISR